MEEKRISIREWQKQYKAGAFNSKDRAVQVRAGWYDWFCKDEALAGRLKKLAPVITGITDPYILDYYYLWLKNNCPLSGPLYDDVRFEPLSGDRDGKYFLVSLDSPHERKKWSLVTERYGFDAPEYECDHVREMVSTSIRWDGSSSRTSSLTLSRKSMQSPDMSKDSTERFLPPFIATASINTAFVRQRMAR